MIIKKATLYERPPSTNKLTAANASHKTTASKCSSLKQANRISRWKLMLLSYNRGTFGNHHGVARDASSGVFYTRSTNPQFVLAAIPGLLLCHESICLLCNKNASALTRILYVPNDKVFVTDQECITLHLSNNIASKRAGTIVNNSFVFMYRDPTKL